MTREKIYENISYHSFEIEHLYGPHVHLFSSPYMLTLLEKICMENTNTMMVTQMVRKAYDHLLNELCSLYFEQKIVSTPTRMHNMHPNEGHYHGIIIDDDNKVVCVDVARAGMVPSQLFFEELQYFLKPENIRQDHIYASRKTDEKHQVIGTEFKGSKIGGDIDNVFLLIPDPMGATGSTVCEVISHYKNNIQGNAKKIITVHLMVTPEYIHKVVNTHPDVIIIAGRLDRGLSSARALSQIPGQLPKDEKGLNHNQYIVPGAGGVGELLNNSFV